MNNPGFGSVDAQQPKTQLTPTIASICTILEVSVLILGAVLVCFG